MEKQYDGEFMITEKQFSFFMEVSGEFVEKYSKEISSREWGGKGTQERHFNFLCDRMLSSDDPELKVNFSRALMFKGFCELDSLIRRTSDFY